MNSPNDHNASKKRRRYYFERTQGLALAVMFVVSTGFTFYLGIITGENIQKSANTVDEKPLARIPVNAPLGNELAVDSTPETKAETAPAKDAVDGKAAPAAVKPEVPDASPASRSSSPTQNGTVNTNAVHRNDDAIMSKNVDVAPASHGADRDKPWSVQVAASVEKDVAAIMAQQLTAKGYEGYVVEGEVTGKTWYRVRVGRMTAREEAESLRQQLVHAKEGLHGAYVTRD
jgi:cell division septation protein DedD